MVSTEEEIATLFEGIKEQLNQDWDRFRDQSHNPTNKGASYEDALGDFLEKYFSGVYEIQKQVAIIDQDLDVFSVFDTNRGGNEIDVVALFENARPRIVFEVGDMTYVPLKGIAFLCEVKSEVDAGRLDDDLSKLQKVTQLMGTASDRWGGAMTGNYSTDQQVRCLIYDGTSISDERMDDLLIEYSDSWDMLLLVQENKLFVNSSLPFYKDIRSEIANVDLDGIEESEELDLPESEQEVESIKNMIERERNFTIRNNGLVMFLLVLTASIPMPFAVDTADILKNLLNEYLER